MLKYENSSGTADFLRIVVASNDVIYTIFHHIINILVTNINLADECLFILIHLIITVKLFREELFAMNYITSSKMRKMCILRLEASEAMELSSQARAWPYPNFA